MEDTFDLPPFVSGEAQQEPRQKRGWWDYVPKRESTLGPPADNKGPGFFATAMDQFRGRAEASNPQFPVMQERKPSTINLIDLDSVKRDKEEGHPNPFHDSYANSRRSPVPSVNSRFSRLFPRMVLFRKVLNDEVSG